MGSQKLPAMWAIFELEEVYRSSSHSRIRKHQADIAIELGNVPVDHHLDLFMVRSAPTNAGASTSRIFHDIETPLENGKCKIKGSFFRVDNDSIYNMCRCSKKSCLHRTFRLVLFERGGATQQEVWSPQFTILGRPR